MSRVLVLGDVVPALPFVFTHVPKTGGSTITRQMKRVFGSDAIAGISSAEPDQRREFLSRCRDENKRYVYGHFRFGDTQGIYDRLNCMIALRHPLERILSLYFMLLRNKSDFASECAQDVRGQGFHRFHDRMVTGRAQDNLICRYLCGEADHRRAIEILQEHYCLAWDTEGSDMAWRELRRTLTGIDVVSSLHRRNAAPVASNPDDVTSGARPSEYSTFLPPESVTLVEEANSADVLLFDWFCRTSDQQQEAALPFLSDGETTRQAAR
ncbi:MAG TPA: sulfotransferase family 2 domain-containing protein [Sphingomicrobium sp.]|nr:sulfotransferase family 2 domain-containing protein [Sphingomicrobium sp.]